MVPEHDQDKRQAQGAWNRWRGCGFGSYGFLCAVSMGRYASGLGSWSRRFLTASVHLLIPGSDTSAFHTPLFSGLQKGPADRGHVKKSRKVSKIFFDAFRHSPRRAKNRQRVSKIFLLTLFVDNFRAAPIFRPPLRGLNFANLPG